ncbi:ArsR/SmtB family transcription factor [Aminobacter sp. UC22_36]|uniref:ArsR/SmtB family transcription factor n=1 Tax=Aminobacter sp. UC22_36 TaxID=3374549 RepID=UPI0037574A52
MDANDTIDALAALAQPTRMEAFRRLAAAEPEGIAAGDLARRLDIPQNTMSTHLAVLTRAGLATGERQGRSIIYRAELTALRKVLLFLLQDCCEGRPEICAPLLASPCCVPQE